MFITSMSLSFVFLVVSLICFGAFLYFKILIIKTGENSQSREKIIGSMKDPASWRSRNNRLSYITLFWSILSLAVFIYLKFFTQAGLIPSYYLFIYVAVIVLSIILFRAKNTAK